MADGQTYTELKFDADELAQADAEELVDEEADDSADDELAEVDAEATAGFQTGSYGGGGGDSWSDNPGGAMTWMRVKNGRYVDSIRYVSGGHTYQHGGNGGHTTHTHDLTDICINQVIVRAKGYVDALTFVGFHLSNPNRTWRSSRAGGGGGDQHTVNLNGCLNGFYGRSKGWFDKIGFFSQKSFTKIRGSWGLI
jgi:hypothetical protein